AGGGPVTYTYGVSNPGSVAVGSIVLADPDCAPISATGGDTNADGLLDLSETWTYTCSTNVVGTTTSTPKVTGKVGSVNATATASVTVLDPAFAAIHVTTSATPAQLQLPGGPVAFGYVVANKGNVPLGGVVVSDTACAPLSAAAGDANANGLLDLTETWTYSC